MPAARQIADGVKRLLVVNRQTRDLGRELAQQSVGFLTVAALPWEVRDTEVHGLVHRGDLTATILAAGASPAEGLNLPQAGDERPAQFAPRVGVDGVVDGLVRHLQLGLFWPDTPQCPSDLLRRSEQVEHVRDQPP